MNLRHAVALALVGWYLILPPALATNPNKPDLTAPLSKWTVHDKMQTATECERKRRLAVMLAHDPDFKEYGEATARQKRQPWSIEKVREFIDPLKCISSDDPRLRGK